MCARVTEAIEYFTKSIAEVNADIQELAQELAEVPPNEPTRRAVIEDELDYNRKRLVQLEAHLSNAKACEARIKEAEAEAAASSATTMCFSSVHPSEVQAMLGKLGLSFAAGSQVVALPQGPCAAGPSIPTNECTAFDYSVYQSADCASAALVAHHQEQLAKRGVPFGPGGFKVYGMHQCTFPLLSFSFQSVEYKGSFSCGVAPFGVIMPASSWVCRVMYEHKASKAEVADSEGEALLQLLAAYAFAPSPVLLDVTDGTTHSLYTIRGREVIMWREVNSTQAYIIQAQHLLRYPSLTQPTLAKDDVPEEEREWMRPFRELRPPCGLLEQLNSVIPCLPPKERFPAALQLIHTWFRGGQAREQEGEQDEEQDEEQQEEEQDGEQKAEPEAEQLPSNGDCTA